MSVVSTIEDQCKACYSCVRNCPVNAIKVELGQSKVVEERCISCGNCVRVCSQNAKQIVSYVEETEKFLGQEKVVALLAPSFPASFYYLEPKEFFDTLKKIGFTDILEVTHGIELTVPAYQEFLATNPDVAISSFCPAIVGMIERQFPSLLPYLVPVDSAVIAAAKYASWKYPEAKIVFIGPCIAKKQEMIECGTGFLDGVLTYKELKIMFESRGLHKQQDRSYKAVLEGISSSPPLFPISGGLTRNLDPNGVLFGEDEIAVVDGKEESVLFLQNLTNELKNGKSQFRFVDILLCKGCIDGPEMDSPLDLFSRKRCILKYAQSKDKDNLGTYPPFNLSRHFTNRYNPLPEPTSVEIKEILHFTNKIKPEDELNCGSCGYNTCQQKAVAVFQGLAEIDMCLPYLVEKSRGELERYKERLEFKKIYFKDSEQFLIGESQSTKELRRLAVQASRNDANVLILGESGVGKEVFAHFTHFLSKRRNNPFIGINCTALPEPLLESELFGYEEGAFTGAKKGGKRGKFEIAEGGTILLDEAGDMSLTLQAKLLRVLQEREIERIGGTRTIKLEARVMAATNRDLQQLVKEGKFRADLYYRLNVINIYIDSLKTRKDDIPQLAISFLHKISQTKKILPKILSEEALNCLIQYNWPGNVRELENMIERLLYTVESNVIQVYHLPKFLNKVVENSLVSKMQPLKTAVQDLEKKMITQALLTTGNNRASAANCLGIPRATFYLKLKEYGFIN